MQVKVFNALLVIAVLFVGAVGAEVFSRQEAIRRALERNPQIRAARQEWKTVRAQASQARALPAPEIEAEWDGLPRTTSIGDFAERNIGVRQQIGWPLEWGRRKEAVGLEAESVRWSALAMVELEIATDVRIAYDQVLSGRQILVYEQEHLKLARDFLHKARLRYEAGDVPQLEVLRAGVEVGRARAGVMTAQNAFAAARGMLNTLMARDVDDALETVGVLEYQRLDLDLQVLKQRALVQRPDLLGAERWVLSKRAWRGAVRASLVPDLEIGVFRQKVRQSAGDENLWRVEMGLAIPLWAPFSKRGALAEVRAGVGRAEAEAEKVRRRVLLEVENALRDLQTAGQLVELFNQDILREAELALVAANRSYEEGKASYLEVLETQHALTETRLEYAQTLLAFGVAQTELERAVGGTLFE